MIAFSASGSSGNSFLTSVISCRIDTAFSSVSVDQALLLEDTMVLSFIVVVLGETLAKGTKREISAAWLYEQ